MSAEKGHMLWLLKQPQGKMPNRLEKLRARNTFRALIDTKAPALVLRPEAGEGRILILCLSGFLRDDVADEFVLAVLPEGTKFEGGNNCLEHAVCATVSVDEIHPPILEKFRELFAAFKPRSHLCPACKGKGRIPHDPAHAPDGVVCHTCGEKGRVTGRAIPSS